MQLKNSRFEVTVDPDFGARVTRLIDRLSGRNWLVGGECQGDVSDQAIFGGQEARGWDECFPTVAPCHSSDWGRDLRDHGDLWARKWNCQENGERVFGEYSDKDFRFQRELVLSKDNLTVHYGVDNLSPKRLPYVWSQHCLLATQPGEQIILQGIDVTQLSNDKSDLNQIDSMESRYAHKSYSRVLKKADVGIDGKDGGIRFSWLENEVPFFGLWLDYGGWPAEQPVHQVAFEATTAPADDLASALKQTNERWIAPGEFHHWKVTINFTTII